MSAVETALSEKNNPNVNSPQKPNRRKWIADAFVIVFCVSGALFSLNLFRLDLLQSIASQNKKPVGTVTAKYNNVQRRLLDRVLWSRLTVESPVYSGDLIRVAEYSSATLNINDDVININENTMIRIRLSSDGKGRVIIDLSSGNLSITGSGAVEGGVALNVMGRVIAPKAGATLIAFAGESGMTLQINEGSAIITEEDGQSRSIDAGEALILDKNGLEQTVPAVVVTLPRPNARFIKNSVEPVNIRFEWKVLNMDQKAPLHLEIASGPNFSRIVRAVNGVDFSNVTLGAGIWYWRLSYQGIVLSTEQFTITDAAMSLISPIQNSLFNYRQRLPSVLFEWQPVEEASYYVLEAGLTPDIKNPSITRQTAVASYTELGMNAGTWYWRVKPVFSSLYEGSADFSQVSSFRVERINESAAVAQAGNNPPTVPIPDVSSSSDGFISSTAGWKAIFHSSSMSDIGIAREKIDGMEKEVLTINATLAGGHSRWAGAALIEDVFFAKVLIEKTNSSRWTGNTKTDMNLIRKLVNANGVRFKALGDGKRWRVYLATTDVAEGAYHGVTISTKKGEVGSFDIPFNKLNQPDWGRRIKFIKNNLKGITIEKNADTGNYGTSTLKVFDFEVY